MGKQLGWISLDFTSPRLCFDADDRHRFKPSNKLNKVDDPL